jgi:hypothetical protein
MYENSMSVIAKVGLDEFNKPNQENVLAAFSDEFCVGNVNATMINEEQSLYFITIFGEDGYEVSFKYFDAENEVYFTTENKILFESNNLIGSVLEPYPIVISNIETHNSLDDFSVYPNPFKEEFEIEFTLENRENIILDIYDVAGRKVMTLFEDELDFGFHKIKIETSGISKGTYFIELKMKDSSIRQTIIKS